MAYTATTQHTRVNVNTIISAWLTHQGIPFTPSPNGPGFVIDGEDLSPGQAADRYVPGGWDAAWNDRVMPPTP